jgi:hypothetical protein
MKKKNSDVVCRYQNSFFTKNDLFNNSIRQQPVIVKYTVKYLVKIIR